MSECNASITASAFSQIPARIIFLLPPMSSTYLENYIIKKYVHGDEKDWNDIVSRVSQIHPPVKNWMRDMAFIPGGRSIATVGTDHVLIPNCVAVDIEDSLDDIFATMNRLKNLTIRGAGIGMNFGKLRPAGSVTAKYCATSCGPVGFLHMYSNVLKTIQQSSRHGAFIGIMPITHPDVLSFITVKQDLTKINNFNLSVLVDEEFMKNLRDNPNGKAMASFNGKSIPYSAITYDPNFVVKDVSPLEITYKELFDEMVQCMWRTGEPGLLFKDNINRTNMLRKYLGDIVACNPCGEISMYPNECCNLGSINLEKFAHEVQGNPLDNGEEAFDTDEFLAKNFDVDRLKSCVHEAIMFLDNVVDKINCEDAPIDEMVRKTRRLGLGVMGVHDILIRLRIPYGTTIGRDIVRKVLGFIRTAAIDTSHELVSTKGTVASRFGIIDDDPLSPVNTMANVAVMTIAPNGSTSMIPNVSSGIEPYFSLGYYRMVDNATNKTGLIINKQLEKYLNENVPADIRDDVAHDILTKGMSSVSDEIIPPFIKEVFRTAQDIAPMDHVRMLAAAQSNVDNAISKTVNLPESALQDDIAECITTAYYLGVKGMTVYRDNCRQNVIINSVNSSCPDGMCDL